MRQDKATNILLLLIKGTGRDSVRALPECQFAAIN